MYHMPVPIKVKRQSCHYIKNWIWNIDNAGQQFYQTQRREKILKYVYLKYYLQVKLWLIKYSSLWNEVHISTTAE